MIAILPRQQKEMITKSCCTENLSLPGREHEFLKKSWFLFLYVQISCKEVLPIAQPRYICISGIDFYTNRFVACANVIIL